MIFGIGTDITDNLRIEKVLEKHSILFLKKYSFLFGFQDRVFLCNSLAVLELDLVD